jgi:hypothetical protein
MYAINMPDSHIYTSFTGVQRGSYIADRVRMVFCTILNPKHLITIGIALAQKTKKRGI